MATDRTSSRRIAAKSVKWFLIARFTLLARPQEGARDVDLESLLTGVECDQDRGHPARRMPAGGGAGGRQVAGHLRRGSRDRRRQIPDRGLGLASVSYTHLRAHETR